VCTPSFRNLLDGRLRDDPPFFRIAEAIVDQS